MTIALERNNLQGGLYFLCLSQDNKVVATNKVLIMALRHCTFFVGTSNLN